MREVYNDTIKVEITVPYVPSYLAFREVPSILELMRRNTSVYQPQVIMVDGNGTLHTRRFGLACHIGVLLDIPCVGVSKTMFAVDGLTKFRA
mmetsp:Transcript_27760/g.5082  ORF Transcript_27760/g.5082 Transcript_27760/m.5082 type:complete len:92 (-) Transcript_27760:1349-1624(-)